MASHRVAHQKLKRLTFEAYGGCKCQCCGESAMEFLTLDHIVPVGRQRETTAIYGLLKSRGFPPGFRVLCMNCNFARGKFGYCPHERL